MSIRCKDTGAIRLKGQKRDGAYTTNYEKANPEFNERSVQVSEAYLTDEESIELWELSDTPSEIHNLLTQLHVLAC